MIFLQITYLKINFILDVYYKFVMKKSVLSFLCKQKVKLTLSEFVLNTKSEVGASLEFLHYLVIFF